MYIYPCFDVRPPNAALPGNNQSDRTLCKSNDSDDWGIYARHEMSTGGQTAAQKPYKYIKYFNV